MPCVHNLATARMASTHGQHRAHVYRRSTMVSCVARSLAECPVSVCCRLAFSTLLALCRTTVLGTLMRTRSTLGTGHRQLLSGPSTPSLPSRSSVSRTSLPPLHLLSACGRVHTCVAILLLWWWWCREGLQVMRDTRVRVCPRTRELVVNGAGVCTIGMDMADALVP